MDSVIGVTCDWKERLKPGEIRILEENIFGLEQATIKWDVLIQGEEKEILIKSVEEDICVQSKNEQQWPRKLVNNLVQMLTESV